jgi:DNA anti-recombination protein RmuC
MDGILNFILVILLAVVIYLLLLQRNRNIDAPSQATMPADLAELKGMVDAFQKSITGGMSMLDSKLGSLEQKFENRISSLDQGFSNSVEAVRTSVENKFSSFVEALSHLNEQLGKLEGHTAQLPDVANGIRFLQRALEPSQSRGRLGELLLEELLRDALPRKYYDTQHDLGGLRVDAVVFVPDRDGRCLKLPIDAKFPLPTDEDPDKLRVALVNSAKQRIGEVQKYVNHGHDVMPMAFCYIPSEGLFRILVETEPSLVRDGMNKGVVLVSPGVLYVYLKMVVLGATTMAIEDHMHRIVQELQSLQTSLEDLEDSFHTLQRHIRNAHNKASEVDTKLDNWRTRLGGMLSNMPSVALPRPESSDPAPSAEHPGQAGSR